MFFAPAASPLGSDLFIATYPVYHALAARMTNDTLVVDDSEMKSERARGGEPQGKYECRSSRTLTL